MNGNLSAMSRLRYVVIDTKGIASIIKCLVIIGSMEIICIGDIIDSLRFECLYGSCSICHPYNGKKIPDFEAMPYVLALCSLLACVVANLYFKKAKSRLSKISEHKRPIGTPTRWSIDCIS